VEVDQMSTSQRRTKPERVLISGAAGGLGAATARRMVADGARVAMTDIDAARLSAIADEIGAIALPADGTQRGAVHSVVEQAAAELGGLDTVIAAQGAAISSVPRPKADEAWFRSLDVNLHGAYFLATEAIPHLVSSAGCMVMVSSTAGLFAGPPGAVGYTAAKSAVIGLVRWLARDLGPRGVRVNAVCPGWMRTALGSGGMAYIAEREQISEEEAYRFTTRFTPLRRVAEPEEVAAVCAFLASADAAMITGQAIAVDGGASAQDVGTAVFDPPLDLTAG
jgi:NAD(P)-dependent dehydrogenase (short-subunit alcohol dehydrogenase family)